MTNVTPYRATTHSPEPLNRCDAINPYRAEAGHSKFREERRRRGACGSEWGDLSAEWLGTAKQASQEVSDTLRGSFSAIKKSPRQVNSWLAGISAKTSLRAEFAETISMQISLGRFRSFPAPDGPTAAPQKPTTPGGWSERGPGSDTRTIVGKARSGLMKWGCMIFNRRFRTPS